MSSSAKSSSFTSSSDPSRVIGLNLGLGTGTGTGVLEVEAVGVGFAGITVTGLMLMGCLSLLREGGAKSTNLALELRSNMAGFENWVFCDCCPFP